MDGEDSAQQPEEMASPRPGSMSRDVMTVAIVSIVALMLGLNLFLFFDDGEGVEGEEAPNFVLPVLDSEESKELAQYRGQVVLMDFWATWCPPCYDQVPALDEVARDPQFKDRVEIFSINVDPPAEEREELIRSFMDEVEATLPPLIDDGEVQRLYGATTIPTLVVVDPTGRVVHVSQGVHDAQRLGELIGEAESP